jgi:hypothetical protein
MRGSGTYLYPQYAHRGGEQAQLADWPPMRPSGPEPGSDDMPPIRGPLGASPFISNMEKSTVVLVGVGVAAWWFFIRPMMKRGRKR